MREIKFRAIPLFGESFVFGSLIIEPNERGEDTYTIRRYENGRVCYFEVKKETIGQYTGLKDKNSVEIYEGDIVNFQHIDDYGYMTNVFQNGFYRGVVKWGEHYPAFDIFDIKDNSTFGFDCNIFSMESDIVIEVIGNIYENPELLNTKG